MATWGEFADWFDDFGRRFPAVAEYSDRHDTNGALLKSWCETLKPFDAATLHACTDGIIDGTFPPVDNFKLGTFAEEIRQRCRQLIDEWRRQRERQHLRGMQQRSYQSETRWMFTCAKATAELIHERAEREPVWSTMPIPGDPIYAAIVLGDEHTEAEERSSLEALAGHGLTWDEVQERASRWQGGFQIFRRVEV